MNPEERAISRLRAAPLGIDNDRLVALEGFFCRLRDIDRRISRDSPTEMYESQWAILGIVSRSYQLMLCCIDQVSGGNWNGFYAAVRGLVETLCSVVWAGDAPERLLALVRDEQVNIGKIMNAGYRKYPGLRETYSFSSGIAHPNRGSHLLGFRPVRERAELGAWSPFTLTFSDDFAARKVALLTEIGPKITQELKELFVQNPDAAKQGKVMARMVAGSPDGE